MKYETIIGLEVHAQLKTESKIFCACATRFGDLPNRNTCPVCLGLPGALPVLNRQAVEFAVRVAVALQCEVRPVSVFARKNYFYPDLPKGYQITQYDRPLAEHGLLLAPLADGTERKIRITRVHLEEDAGRNIHLPQSHESLVDFNRCGVPLVEIVSEPDLRSPAEAAAYLRELRDIVRFLGVCDGNMEEGSFRCDANVSVKPEGSDRFGVRIELKNINSFRFVEKGLEYEVQRHVALLESGRAVIPETRHFDAATGRTSGMRAKEEEHDYRYFPEPDLPRLELVAGQIAAIRSSLPKLPADYRAALVRGSGLPPYDVEVLTAHKDLAEYACEVMQHSADCKLSSNWLMTELMAVLNEKRWTVSEFPVPAREVALLVNLLAAQKLSVPLAKQAFLAMWSEGRSLEQAVAEVGMQVSDDTALGEVCRRIVDDSPQEVAKYVRGGTQLMAWFVGRAMKETRGKGNPRVLTRIFTELLETKKSP